MEIAFSRRTDWWGAPGSGGGTREEPIDECLNSGLCPGPITTAGATTHAE